MLHVRLRAVPAEAGWAQRKDRLKGLAGRPSGLISRPVSPTLGMTLTFELVCKKTGLEFPGGPVVRTRRFHCRGHGFDPCSGN